MRRTVCRPNRPAPRRVLLAVVEPRPDGSLVDDVKVGGWSMPWNARPEAGRLDPGIPKSNYLVRLASVADVDIDEAVRGKLTKNRAKYPPL